jgi:hypothetical protein
METFKYSYVAKVHSAPESECVGFGLEGEHGQRFIALLSIADAERLADDLAEQVRAAKKRQ